MSEDIIRANDQQKKEIDLIRDIILQTVAPLQIYLFGSYAYGEPTADSDYDFYVIMPDDSDRENDVHLVITKALLAQNAYNNAIDLLVKKRSYFEERNPLPSMERTILKKGILLYDAG